MCSRSARRFFSAAHQGGERKPATPTGIWMVAKCSSTTPIRETMPACARTCGQAPPPRMVLDENLSLHLARSSYGYRLRIDAQEQEKRPRVLLVTPFCIFPPRHGGARRIAELLRVLRRDFDVILVSDEALQYDARSYAHFDGLYAVYLVQRRDP